MSQMWLVTKTEQASGDSPPEMEHWLTPGLIFHRSIQETNEGPNRDGRTLRRQCKSSSQKPISSNADTKTTNIYHR
jgi:hypothetical protein